MVNKPVGAMRYREAKNTAVAALEAGRILYRRGEISAAKKIFSSELRKIRGPIKRDADFQEKFKAFWRELYEDSNRMNGKITSVNAERGFVIITSIGNSNDTFLGHVYSFEPKITSLSGTFFNKLVSFTPTEKWIDGKNKKGAYLIRLLDDIE